MYVNNIFKKYYTKCISIYIYIAFSATLTAL